MTLFLWIGIVLCLSQSAMLSGLNLAFFTISKLELQMEVVKGNKQAYHVLTLRKDANFLLVTILWANVAVNVLLALLSGSVLSGITAFLFSTVVITIFGEIFPQAYFSRHALKKFGSLFSPLLCFYQLILFPVAKPTALHLDRYLGPEAISSFKEKDIRQLIKLYMETSESDIEKVEGRGALNFLDLDDVHLAAEGEPVDPGSIIPLPFEKGKPVFPAAPGGESDLFLNRIHECGKKWIVLVDPDNASKMVLNSDEFIRDALFNRERYNPYWHCHRPVIVTKRQTTIGDVITRLRVNPEHFQDDVVDHDVILLWSETRRIITGGDILGRLLRGIVQNPVLDQCSTGNSKETCTE
jgi:metal transporter CNNM